MTFNGQLLAFGGADQSNTYFADVWASEDGVQWTEVSTMPVRLAEFSAVVVPVGIFVTGGGKDDGGSTVGYAYTPGFVRGGVWCKEGRQPFQASDQETIKTREAASAPFER